MLVPLQSNDKMTRFKRWTTGECQSIMNPSIQKTHVFQIDGEQFYSHRACEPSNLKNMAKYRESIANHSIKELPDSALQTIGGRLRFPRCMSRRDPQTYLSRSRRVQIASTESKGSRPCLQCCPLDTAYQTRKKRIL